RPDFREAVADLVDGVVGSYRERMGAYPSLLIGLANVLGLINRDRLVSALHAALRRVVDDPDDPLRRRLAEVLAELPARLRPEGAVRLIEEHAGDDLQYIRVNGTVVGGLAGGAIYGIHLLLRLVYDLGRGASRGTSLSRRRFSRTLSSRLPEPTGGHRMTRARIAALPASFALLTLTLASPATTEAQTPKSGGVLNMMLREDLADRKSVV